MSIVTCEGSLLLFGVHPAAVSKLPMQEDAEALSEELTGPLSGRRDFEQNVTPVLLKAASNKRGIQKRTGIVHEPVATTAAMHPASKNDRG